MTTKLDAPYTFFTIHARSTAPHSEEVRHFDLRSRHQDYKTGTNSRFNATSAANARMSAANRGSAEMGFWNGNTQRLQSLSLDIPKIGAIPVRPFATDAHCYSQAEPRRSQEALFEAEAEAEAASLERQLENLQIPTVALNDVDDNSARFAEKIAKLRPQLRALKSNQSKSENPAAQAPGGERVPLRVVRSQKSHAPKETSRVRYMKPALKRHIATEYIVPRSLTAAEKKHQAKHSVEYKEPLIRRHLSDLGPLGRYVREEQRLPPPTDMLFRKVNTVLAENKAFKSQLEIGEYHKSAAGEGTKTGRGPRKNASDPNSPIRFISNTETEDAHIEVPPKLSSELPEKSIELDVEPIEIRRHLSLLPSKVRYIRRVPSDYVSIQHVPGFYVSKHLAAEKMVTTQEGNLLIRKHTIGQKSEEPPSGLSHSINVPEIQESKPHSPKDQARELHSKYSSTSLHDMSPKDTQKPREQYFTFRKHKSDAQLPIFVKGSS